MTTRFRLSAGFTLFEILIAIFIFGILITTIFGSYRFVFSKTDAVREHMERYEMAKNCLNRMITDLQSAYIAIAPLYIPPEFNNPPDPYRIVSDTAGSTHFPRLRFTSGAHVLIDGSGLDGIAEIVYYVQTSRDEEHTFVLKRSDRLIYDKPFEENADDPILCEGLKSIAYTFYDDEHTEHDSWNSESDEFKFATPRSIKIKIELGTSSTSSFFAETMITLPIWREKTE